MSFTKLLWLFPSIFCICLNPQAHSAEGASGFPLKERITIKKKSYWDYSKWKDSQEFSLARMETLSQKRATLIRDISSLLPKEKRRDKRIELDHRLAGLHYDDYFGRVALAYLQYEMAMAEFKKGKDKSLKPPMLDLSQATPLLDMAMDLYRDLYHRYPKDDRRDLTLYYLGTCYVDKGWLKQAMGYYGELLAKHPNSVFTNDALVQVGDYYFDRNHFRRAESFYFSVIRAKDSHLKSYAVYKSAWCAYNTGRIPLALEKLTWVIVNEDRSIQNSGHRVKNEAIADIALLFVDLKKLSESILFFKSLGEPHQRSGLETMAALYLERGDHKRAIRLWDVLLQMDPNHVKNPTYDLNILGALNLKDEKTLFLSGLFSGLAKYWRGSVWYRANSDNEQALEETMNKFEEITRTSASRYHWIGQKASNTDFYNAAKRVYIKYLAYFPKTRHSAFLRFYLAEILYKQKAYGNAADHYLLVYKDSDKETLREKSITFALAALDQELIKQGKTNGLFKEHRYSRSTLRNNGEGFAQFIPYSKMEKKFLEVADDYLKKYEKKSNAPDVLYELAAIQYTHREFDEAFDSFSRLVKNYPLHPSYYSAAHLVLDILNRRKDYDALVMVSKDFLRLGAPSKKEFLSEVKSILRQTELKRIALIEEKSGYHEAAGRYMDYVFAYGVEDFLLMEKALYNASVNFTKANLFSDALKAQEKFLGKFPGSPFRENLLLQAAKNYETVANLKKAADYFEQYSKEFATRSQAKNARRLAALYHWGSGNPGHAEAMMLEHLDDFPNDGLIEQDLVDFYESRGESRKLASYYERSAKSQEIAERVWRLVRIAELHAGRTGKLSKNTMKEAWRLANHSKRIKESAKGRELLARMMFWSIQNRVASEFYSTPISIKGGNLEKRVQRKLVLLKNLEREFLKVISLDHGDWHVAALFETAFAYFHLSTEIANVPAPKNLPQKEQEVYRTEIARIILQPLKDKALARATQCIERGNELRVFSRWIAQCYAVAHEIDPKTFPVVRTLYLSAVQTALPLPIASESLISIGDVERGSLPHFSTALFMPPSVERNPSAYHWKEDNSFDRFHSRFSATQVVPIRYNYRLLAEKRRKMVAENLHSRKLDGKEEPTFALLNLERFQAPELAIPKILNAIAKDPLNSALHNLLALAYLDSHQMNRAKVTYFSLIARGIQNPEILNNLGVIAQLEGRETQAIAYFEEASRLDSSREAYLNLGSIALRYRNGELAKHYFEKSLRIESNDATAEIGLAEARIQNREFDQVRECVVELSNRFSEDPYARLSVAYFLIDLEKNYELAREILSEYLKPDSVEGEPLFLRARREATELASTGSFLKIRQ